MLSNISKLFKKGGSHSNKDRPNPFSESHNYSSRGRGSSRGSQQSLRGRSSKHNLSTGDIRSSSSIEDDSSANGQYSNSPSSPRLTGFDDTLILVDRSGISSPAHPTVNGKPVTDPKVLQLLGADDGGRNVMAAWMETSKEGSREFSRPDESETEGFPDIDRLTFPKKSELPPSFEFARPTGQALNKDIQIGEGNYHPDTGESSTPGRPELDLPHAFPFGQANRSYGEDSSFDNGTATGSEADSVESIDAHPVPTTKAYLAPLLTFRPSSPKPSVEFSSPSPRASTEERSWGSNHTRQEGVSWGSNGSVSPRWVYSGQPSPERGNRIPHPLPPPPPSTSSSPHSPVYEQGAGWTEGPKSAGSRDWQGPPSYYQPYSPSQRRSPPRLSSHLSPRVSPIPSPPRSPVASPRPSFPPGSWSPLPAPPLSPHSPFHSPPRSPSRIPRTLTKWKKIKQIGVGSFGTVHEAINL
jgi:hypothetical protein